MAEKSWIRGIIEFRYLPFCAALLAFGLFYTATTVAVFPVPNAVTACTCWMAQYPLLHYPKVYKALVLPNGDWCSGTMGMVDHTFTYQHFSGPAGCGLAAIIEFGLGFLFVVLLTWMFQSILRQRSGDWI